VQSTNNNHKGTLHYINTGDEGSKWKAWVPRLEGWLCIDWGGCTVKLHNSVKGWV